MRALFLTLLAITATACSSESGDSATNAPAPTDATANVAWPSALQPLGDGYPKAGDPCRQLAETDGTRNFLDDSAMLVGCPSAAQASGLGGKVVATVEGITLVSVPAERGQPDAVVPGTAYQATSELPCSLAGKSGQCKAGVKRAPDQIGVEVTSLDGILRTLLFDGSGKFVTHSSSQADGSAALQSSARRAEDWTIVTLGAEQYRVPDAFLLGS